MSRCGESPGPGDDPSPLGATPTAVAESRLLQHSPNLMLIPGTSSVDHLRENIAGAALALPPDAVAELDAI